MNPNVEIIKKVGLLLAGIEPATFGLKGRNSAN